MNRTQAQYRSLSSWLKAGFGGPVRKVSIDAGLGCPNRDGTLGHDGCLYCNPRGSGTGAHAQGISIMRQVDISVDYLSKRFRCSQFIAYFQSFTNTYAPLEDLDRIYREALQHPQMKGIAIGTRPDCVADPVLDLLAEIGRDYLVWVEYGLQSAHDRTLDRINRGHGSDAFYDAVTRSKLRGLRVVAHLILGLPGESTEQMIETAQKVGDSGVWGVKLHPLYVIRGTGLDALYKEKGYEPLTEEQALQATVSVLEALPADTVIHRLTSDPHAQELVAPKWMLDRRGVRNRLDKAIEDMDIRQGSKYLRRLRLNTATR